MKDELLNKFDSNKLEETQCSISGGNCVSSSTSCYGDQCTQNKRDYNGVWGEFTGDNWQYEDPCG